MKVDEIKINKAYEELRKAGAIPETSMLDLYTLKEGCFFLGTYTGEKKILNTQYGEVPYYVFQIELGELINKNGQVERIENKKCGIIANASFEKKMEKELVKVDDEWKLVDIDRTNHRISCIYLRKERVKKEGKKKAISVSRYDFRDLTLIQS